MIKKLEYISTEEGITIDTSTLSELIRQSEGDMRRAIQMLQSLSKLHGEEMSPQASLAAM